MKTHVGYRWMMMACLFAANALVGNAQNWKVPGDGSWGDWMNWEGDAVPGGAALVAFTNIHAGLATVTLDGNRTQTGGMTFGGGDWLIAPGDPADSALTLSQSVITTLDGVTTLTATGSVTSGKISFRGEGEFQLNTSYLFSNTGIDSGIVRVMPTGAFSTYSGSDIYIDGTGSLVLDGGTINTKIVRMGQDIFPTNTLFCMNSGTVNCGGSGDAVLLIGYNNIDSRSDRGTAVAKILGGTFSATGTVANAGVFIGTRHHGTLLVGSADTPAELNCGRIWFGWKDSSDSHPITNHLIVATNGTVNASVATFMHLDVCTAIIRLERGGLLRTPSIYSRSTGPLDVVFEGGSLELNGASNTVFMGVNTRVIVNKESELNIGANNVTSPAPFAGSGTLVKSGTGTLSLSGSHAGFDGAWAVAEGALALAGNAALPETAAILLADGTALDVSAFQSLSATVVTEGNVTVAVHPSDTTFNAFTLGDGTVVFTGDGTINILALDVPDGVTVDTACAGHVTIGTLTGGGALTVSGGGTFDVVDDDGFDGTIDFDQNDGTVLNVGIDVVETLFVSADTVINTYGKTLTVQVLTLAGGTVQVAGGGELVVQNLVVTGDASIISDGMGGAVTNIASLVIAPDVTFTLDAQETVYIGTARDADLSQVGGTLRLSGGVVVIADLHSGIGFDIISGEVFVTSASELATAPAFPSGAPAFWVDASQAASLTASPNNKVQEWRDWRGGDFTMKATPMNVEPTVIPEPALGGENAVRFASPHNYGTYKGMIWDQRLTNIRTVFWVIGAQEGGGQLLGDNNEIDFLRGEYPPGRPGAGSQLDWPKGIHYAPIISKSYADDNRNHMACIRDGLMRLNSVPVNPVLTGYPHPGYHVVSLRATNDVCATAFAAERTTRGDDRSGCQRLAECLVFTNALTDAEIAATETYLQQKWFGAGVRARKVRIGDADARFTVQQGGGVMIDDLHVDVAGLSPENAVAGVARVDQLTVSHDLALSYNGAVQSLPLDVQALRVEAGAEITVTAPPYEPVWIGQIAGHGGVAVADGLAIEIGSAVTQAGEILTLAAGSAVPVTVRSWLAQGNFEVTNASSVTVSYADIAGNARLAVTGGAATPLQMSIIRATGAWTLEGSVDPFIDAAFLYGSVGQTFTLDTGGNDLRINVLHGRNTLVWNGPDKIRIIGSLRADSGNNPTLPAEAFCSPIPAVYLSTESRSITFTGNADLDVTSFIVESTPATTCYLYLAPDVSMTVAKFEHRPSNNASLYLPQEGTLTIDSLLMRSQCAIFFPANRITTVRLLATTPDDGRVIVRNGTLRVLETINTCRYFTTIGDGIIFPDNMTLTPTPTFEMRTSARFDLGEGSTLTFALPGLTLTNNVTFARGALRIDENMTIQGALRLEGTELSVTAGKTLTADALTGDSTVTLAAGATFAVANMHGYDGTIINNGGTLHVNNPIFNTVPTEPAVAPTFWVDASESGAFVTNSSSQLVWLDKRTVRDGASGMMYATSSNMPSILYGELNGLPVVNFGPLGSGQRDERGMTWSTRLSDVRAVHWVIGAQDGGGMLLGNFKGGHIDYFRYNDGKTTEAPNHYGLNDYRTPLWPCKTRAAWQTRDHMMNVFNGVTYMNGELMAAPAESEGFPSPDYHLVSLLTDGPTCAAAFASERVGETYGARSGAQRLGEVLIYDGRVLTAEENRANDAYLAWKWFAKQYPEYRLPDENLIVLRGSGNVSGENVLVREIASAAAGFSVDGNLHLSAYPAAAADVGAVIRLDTLPATGTAAVSVTGDVFLPSRVTVVLGEVQAGIFTVLDVSGTIHGSTDWLLDTTALPNASAFQISLVQEGNTVLLKISGKGTTLLLR